LTEIFYDHALSIYTWQAAGKDYSTGKKSFWKNLNANTKTISARQ
jgi:hypothetical protein